MKNTNHNFTRLFLLTLATLGIMTITGCNTEARQLENNQAYLIFNSSSRAASDSAVENLTDIVLTGRLEGGKSQTLGQWTTWAGTQNKVITITAGKWNFTLTAKLDGTLYYDTTQKDIIAGTTNKVEFLLTEGSPAELELDVDIDYEPTTLVGENGGVTVTYAPCKDGIEFNFTANENKLRQVTVGNEIWIEKNDINATNFYVVFPFTKKGETTDYNILVDYDYESEAERDSWYISIQAGGGYKTTHELYDFAIYDSFTYSAENEVLKAQGEYTKLIPANSAVSLSNSLHLNFFKLVEETQDYEGNEYFANADVNIDDLFGDGISLSDLFSRSTMNSMCKDENINEDRSYRYYVTVTYPFEFKNNVIPGINFDYTGFTFTHTDWLSQWSKGKYITGNYTPKDILPLEPGTLIWEPTNDKEEFTVIPSETDNPYAPERKLVIPGNKFRTETSELTKDNTIRIWGKYDQDVNGCNIILASAGWKDWTLSGSSLLNAKRDYFTHRGYVDIPLKDESDELIADIATNGISLYAWWSQQQYTKIEIVGTPEQKEDSTAIEDLTLSTNSQDGWNNQYLENPIELTENYRFIKASVSVDQLDKGYDEHNLVLELRDSSDNVIACLESSEFTKTKGFEVAKAFDIYCELPEPPASSEENPNVFGIYNINYAITHDDLAENNSQSTRITIHSLVLTDQLPPDAFGEEEGE